jgi:hypothetical protein
MACAFSSVPPLQDRRPVARNVWQPIRNLRAKSLCTAQGEHNSSKVFTDHFSVPSSVHAHRAASRKKNDELMNGA